MKEPFIYLVKRTDEAIAHARLRVWAADVRDQRPPYELVTGEGIMWADLLCTILDTIDVLQRSRRLSVLDLDRTKMMILKRLEERGLQPPLCVPGG